MVYHTRAVAAIGIEDVSEDGVEVCLEAVMSAANFVGPGSEYGAVKARFSTAEEAASHATAVLCSETVAVLPTFRGG